MKRTIIVTIIIVVVICSFIYYMQKNDNAQSGTTTHYLKNISVHKPNLIIDSVNLTRVEVWAIPTGTGVTADDYQKLGNATLLKNKDGVEEWQFPIPQEPMLISQLFARGYGAQDIQVQDLALSVSGATDLYNELWQEATATTSTPATNTNQKLLTLKPGKSASFQDLKVTLLQILDESRCPQGVQCIWAGEVTTELMLTQKGSSQKITLKDTDQAFRADDYTIRITEIKPAPTQGTTKENRNYEITFLVTKVI